MWSKWRMTSAFAQSPIGGLSYLDTHLYFGTIARPSEEDIIDKIARQHHSVGSRTIINPALYLRCTECQAAS